MKFEKALGGTYKAIQEDGDIEMVDSIFSNIFIESLDEINPHVRHIKKKSLFVDILVDKFVSQIEFNGMVVINSTGTYDVSVYIMKSDVKEIPGLTFSFE